MPIGAAIGGVGALASAGASIWGANKAADAQTQAASMANSTIQQQQQANTARFDASSANLAPWIQGGGRAFDATQMFTGTNPGGNPLTAPLTTPFAPTMAQLESTPGYQFIKDQGLKSVQNSYASKGLGTSGASMKGAADYAEGLAGTTYQQQFQNYWSQNKSIYDMLTGQATQGLQGANAVMGGSNTLAGINTGAAGTISGNTIGMGNAQGAAANATGAGIGAGINGMTMYNLLGNYLSNGTNNGNLSPAQFQQYGKMDASSLTDAQANAYGKYMGFD